MGKDRPTLIGGRWEWWGVGAGEERPLTCRWRGIFGGAAELPAGPGSPQAPVGEEEFVPPPGSAAAPSEAASAAGAVGWVQAESFRPLGARMLKIFALAGGALGRGQAGPQLRLGVLLHGSKTPLGPFWASLGGQTPSATSLRVWGNPAERPLCCGWGHSGAGLLPKARQPTGRLLSHGAQLSALSSSPGAVTRGCGQR